MYSAPVRQPFTIQGAYATSQISVKRQPMSISLGRKN